MKIIQFELTQRDWEILRDGVADVMCWHLGFEAANPNYKPPPQLSELSDLIGTLKKRVNEC